MTLASLRLRLPRVPVAIQFTRQGLVFVFLSLAIGAAAVNTGNNVLYLIFSLMLALIIVSGMTSRRMLQGLTPEIIFPDQVFAGTSQLCFLTIQNRKKKLPSIGIHFQINQTNFPKISRYFFFIPANRQLHSYASAVFRQRGIYSLNEIELQTRFPFSFLTKIRRYFPEQTIRVYPRMYRLSDELIARLTDGTFLESPYRGDSHQLLHIRDYTFQDSSKRIHWKASAKAEKLVVKDYQKEQGRNLYVYYDCYPPASAAGNQLLETGLSLAGSLALLISEKGIRGKIVFPDRSFEVNPGASIIALLDYLAELETFPAGSKYLTPEGPDTVVLMIRSRRSQQHISIPSVLSHTIFVEDWLPILQQESSHLK